MKVKYIVATVVVILAAAWALAFWWPATHDEEGQNGLDHGGHTREEEVAAGAEENHDGHGHGEQPQEDDGHDGHDDHDEEAGEEEHGDEVVRLSAAQLQEFGIVLTTARSGRLSHSIELPGEIVLNADRLAHVVPRVSGLVRQVHKSVGDTVQEDEVMALLESRELADAKAAYLAAVERHKLALANFQREERLWADQITSEQEFLVARQLLAEARINRSSAKQQLHALGFSAEYLKTLPHLPDATYTLY
ncbi:MAG: efflux RND transporter periplasmic adaptor subunit, partial [Deltaproteobacteria bacterium]|nr:efflux RND transporter periplasmic adaptor subunit [Deltaproteobacteria bacterium]